MYCSASIRLYVRPRLRPENQMLDIGKQVWILLGNDMLPLSFYLGWVICLKSSTRTVKCIPLLH